MTLSQLLNTTSQIFGHLHISTATTANVLIIIGLAIGFIVIISAVGYGMFKLAKALPSMSVRQFILFLLLLAISLVVIGILIP